MDDLSYYVHPLAQCESTNVGRGTRIWAHCHVMAGARVGAGCNLGEQVFVENGVTVGDGCTVKNGVALWEGVTLETGVFVGPNAAFTNDFLPRAFRKNWRANFRPTRVKRGASIGANATILCGVTIGEYALIGAGAVVTRDVAPFTLVTGNPAKARGRVCYCGTRLQDDYCPACRKPLDDNCLETVLASFEAPASAE
jgi:acetyltransferase-like isoleucine patch superfamily enzyme